MIFIVFEGEKLAHTLLPINHSLDHRPSRASAMTPCGIDSDDLRDYKVTDQVVPPLRHCPGCSPDLAASQGEPEEEEELFG